jgi:hypothetical protein
MMPNPTRKAIKRHDRPYLCLQAPCGCIRTAIVPPVTADRQRQLWVESRRRGYTVRSLDEATLRLLWHCKRSDCPFRPEASHA